ncbi:c-type cytochrome biogenesis protein CcmI [[Haemophilus] ducreyi]|uniref:Cytochrome c-type biogenesis protein H TPR domain-containing protein n=1 Tax=Haemophilus ducreyi TaxID=730 RepID=A0AAC8UB11_HAEDC|nr:c-type cytochrome biogenesis protein CcmI [[Haemophilus] ducreyi]AKO30255.1 hypothetical protein RY60_00245 [[Haemophilus] ducreyi]AKO31688.1 hypothetical protein RZ57_00250 [[Haemophilus] ducreyi]AKO33141.1 hypothetical protein RZ58_00250 [[Haemophilus] ducreyi]AKO34590.1 hypothetical protein RZ59_00245 [[Haemophilus] ducreyi]AKO36024.1 hypothetical protein RZ61_00255 [[Haemophilus] ducreyi]
MNFWLIVAIITVFICLIAFYPLLKKSKKQNTLERDHLNKAFYFDRLQEVEREANEGIIDDLEKSKVELQQSLLDDIPMHTAVEQPTLSKVSRVWFLGLLCAVSAISLLAYMNVGSWQATKMLDMTHQKLDYFYARIKDEDKNPLSETELNQFAVALRVDLQRNPNNAKGWFMLGQMGIARNDGQLAFESYEKASKLAPNNLQYKSKYAQALMFLQDKADKEKGKQVLKEIIRQDHRNLDALSLLAFNSFEEEDYQMAAATWGMMLKLIPQGEPRRATIEKSVNMAISLLKAKEQKEPVKNEKK